MNKSSVVSHMTDLEKLWHYRLGHLPYYAMKNIKDILISFSDKKIACEVCPMARQSRPPFSKSRISSKTCIDLLHIDTWGPYNTPTYKGEKYFLTVVDDFSRTTWTFLLSAKSNAFPVLKSCLALVERQFSA